MRTLTQNHVVHLNAYLAEQKLPFAFNGKMRTMRWLNLLVTVQVMGKRSYCRRLLQNT